MTAQVRSFRQRRTPTPIVAFCLLCFVLTSLLAGCASREGVPYVPLDNGERQDDGTSSSAGKLPLRIGIAPVLSARASFRLYGDLAEYLAAKLGREPQLLQRPTYRAINDLVRYGHCDFAFVCDYAYLLGRREFGLTLLALPEVNGETVYYSYLIVPANGTTKSLADLRGTVFAFSDPLSNSGWLVPVYQLLQLNETPERFFKKTLFTHSHDNSIKAVADRLVDGAAIDSLVYEGMVAKDSSVGERTKVVARWGPYGIPPVVAHPEMSPDLRQQVLQAMLAMHEQVQGRRILSVLGIDRFVPAADGIYDSVRTMAEVVEKARAQ